MYVVRNLSLDDSLALIFAVLDTSNHHNYIYEFHSAGLFYVRLNQKMQILFWNGKLGLAAK